MQQLDPYLQQRVDRFRELAALILARTISIPQMLEFKAIAMLLSIATVQGDLPRDTFDLEYLGRISLAVKQWREDTAREFAAAKATVEQGTRQWN